VRGNIGKGYWKDKKKNGRRRALDPARSKGSSRKVLRRAGGWATAKTQKKVLNLAIWCTDGSNDSGLGPEGPATFGRAGGIQEGGRGVNPFSSTRREIENEVSTLRELKNEGEG